MSKTEDVCYVCKSEHSKTSDDTMVFCCECRRPYHRLCHNPPVDRICIEVLDVQFYCSACVGHHAEQSLETGVPSTDLSSETRKAYLHSLSKTQLIYLLQFAETLHPTLPIYSPYTTRYVAQLKQESEDMREIRGQLCPGNEDLLVGTIADYARAHADSAGLSLGGLFQELETSGKVPNMDAAFKHSATRALQRALRKSMIVERNGLYLPNSDFHATTELYLTQLLKADDTVIFAHIPCRVPEAAHVEVEKSEVFGHRIYMHT